MKISRYIKTFLAVAVLLLCGQPFAAQALSVSDAVEETPLSAKAYIVVDRASGQVLLSKQPDLPWAPASMTKMVTALVALDMNPDWNARIALKKVDNVGGNKIPAPLGTVFTFRDYWNAMLVYSANNAANVVARSTGLTQKQFIARMNEKAKELGATGSHFVEASGMSRSNVTTAADMAKIAAAAFARSEVRDAALQSMYTLRSIAKRPKAYTVRSTNALLADTSVYQPLGKTGYIGVSGYNFAVNLEAAGHELLVVVLGTDGPKAPFREAKKLATLGGLSVPQVAGASTTSSTTVLTAATVPAILP